MRMRFMRTQDIKPGMVTAKSIYDNSGTLLIPANHTITDDDIMQMLTLNCVGICIYDMQLDSGESNSIMTRQERTQAVSTEKTIDIDKVVFYTNQIVSETLSRSDLSRNLQDMRLHHNATYNHCINVSLYATACGIGLGMQLKELQDLAAAAMLHDIGKNAIDISILDKSGKLTLEERNIINEHPVLGCEILCKNLSISTAVKAGVLSHHENEDGSGYPQGLKDNDIPLIAKIIHVADVYDALCSKRSYKDNYQVSECIEFLLSHCGTMFDICVVRTFIKYLVVYPVGVDVELSDGRIARVIKNRARFIQRPVVATEDETIDLLKVLNITILGTAIQGTAIQSPVMTNS